MVWGVSNKDNNSDDYYIPDNMPLSDEDKRKLELIRKEQERENDSQLQDEDIENVVGMDIMIKVVHDIMIERMYPMLSHNNDGSL